jgi:DHA2 family multidrug resistance protein
MTDAAASWTPERSAAGGHNPYLIAFVVSIATFMEVLDATIANVALRHIAGGLAVGIDESTYIVTSYLAPTRSCFRSPPGCRRSSGASAST